MCFCLARVIVIGTRDYLNYVQRISCLCYGGYKLPYVNNLNFPESMFAL